MKFGSITCGMALGATVALVGCQDFDPSDLSASTTTTGALPIDDAAEDEGPIAADPTAIESVEVAANVQEKSMSDASGKVVKTEAEWKEILTPEQYRILRQKGTEAPDVNEFDHHFEPGVYVCAACGAELFASETKFNSGCGWPAFYAAKAGDRVTLTPDYSHFMKRVEVTCAKCDGHLGHIFDDAPDQPTGQRYCINSVSLKFIPKDAERPSDKSADEAKSAADELGDK